MPENSKNRLTSILRLCILTTVSDIDGQFDPFGHEFPAKMSQKTLRMIKAGKTAQLRMISFLEPGEEGEACLATLPGPGGNDFRRRFPSRRTQFTNEVSHAETAYKRQSPRGPVYERQRFTEQKTGTEVTYDDLLSF